MHYSRRAISTRYWCELSKTITQWVNKKTSFPRCSNMFLYLFSLQPSRTLSGKTRCFRTSNRPGVSIRILPDARPAHPVASVRETEKAALPEIVPDQFMGFGEIFTSCLWAEYCWNFGGHVEREKDSSEYGRWVVVLLRNRACGRTDISGRFCKQTKGVFTSHS